MSVASLGPFFLSKWFCSPRAGISKKSVPPVVSSVKYETHNQKEIQLHPAYHTNNYKASSLF